MHMTFCNIFLVLAYLKSHIWHLKKEKKSYLWKYFGNYFGHLNNALIRLSTSFYIFGCCSFDEPFWYLLHKKVSFDTKNEKWVFYSTKTLNPLVNTIIQSRYTSADWYMTHAYLPDVPIHACHRQVLPTISHARLQVILLLVGTTQGESGGGVMHACCCWIEGW